MGNDVRLASRPAGEADRPRADLGAPEGQGAGAQPGRWTDTLPLLLVVLLLLLSPVLYDLVRWLRAG